jgi:hypothetical protein
MTIIEKIVKVPKNRIVSLKLQIPESVTTDEVNILVTITPNPKKCQTLGELNKFKGFLKDVPELKGDGVEIQRKIRDE